MTAPNQGIQTSGEILYNQLTGVTADGTDFNAVWQEFHALLTIWNQETTNISDLLTFRTTIHAEAIPNGLSTGSMEVATELGVPSASGAPGEALLVGYRYLDYDKSTRVSWKFARDCDVRQLHAIMDNILRLDQKLMNGLVFDAVFNNTRRTNEFGVSIYDLYDGVAPGPPQYMQRTFLETENHYIASGAATLDSQDITDAIRLIVRKGYTQAANAQLLIFANPDEAELIMGWRAGEASRTDGPDSPYSFIPAINSPPFITPGGDLVGAQVPDNYEGLKIEGSWGPAWLTQSDSIPAGYVLVAVSYGKNSALNCVGLREHPNAAYRGLRLIPGHWQNYPLIESFAARGAGCGVRQRGAAVAVMVTSGSTYEPPDIPM